MNFLKRNQVGFTIVELLIVIVVIAILAAITIVAYNGIQNRAKASSAQTAAAQAGKRIMQFSIESGTDTFPANQAAFDGLNISSGSASFQYTANNPTNPRQFCVTATVQDVSFFMNNTSQTSPVRGGCPGHGQAGVAAVTNLSVNPRLAVNSSGYFSQTPLNSLQGRAPASGQNNEATYSVSTSVAGQLRIQFLGSAIPVVAGEQIRIAYDLYSSVAFSGLSTEVQFNGTTWQGFAAGAVSVGWGRYSSIVTAPANATSITMAQVLSPSSGVPASANFNITNIMITRGLQTYQMSDGESQNWVWNGTRYNSSSTGPGN